MWNSGQSPKTIVEKEGLVQVSDENVIRQWVEEVLKNNQKFVDEYRAGRTKLLGFFVGEIMKKSQGKANPATIHEILKKKLDSKGE